MTPASRPVWRVSLLWQGTILDTVSLKTAKGRSASLTLRTGEALKARIVDDGLEVSGPELQVTLRPGQFCALPAGHVLHADVDAGNAQVASFGGVDSTMLHATMIGVALQVCVFSALWLTPVTSPSDVGAGIASDARRWLALPGGTAATVGKPTFSATGRKAAEAERVEVKRQRGGSPRRGRVPSLDQTLEAMKAALHPGDDGDLRESVGQLSLASAQAPQLGAGVGGLSPRDPAETGPGSGVIGAGTTVALDLLRQRIADADQRPDRLPPRQATFPVQLQEVPDAKVDGARIDADPELDPIIREHLTRTVRGRHNVIRSCYEAWGLAADSRRSGRLVLELTLQPDGHVTDVAAETSSEELRRVGDCVVRAASEWYLGGVVETPTRLAFPFLLQPRS